MSINIDTIYANDESTSITQNVPENVYSVMRGNKIVLCPMSYQNTNHGGVWITRPGYFFGSTTRDCPRCKELTSSSQSIAVETASSTSTPASATTYPVETNIGRDIEDSFIVGIDDVDGDMERLVVNITAADAVDISNFSNDDSSAPQCDESSTIIYDETNAEFDKIRKLQQERDKRELFLNSKIDPVNTNNEKSTVADFEFAEVNELLTFIQNLSRNILKEMDPSESQRASVNSEVGGAVNIELLLSHLYETVGSSIENTEAFYRDKSYKNKTYKVAVIGTTGAGKSALIGSLLGYCLEINQQQRNQQLSYSGVLEDGFSVAEADELESRIGKPELGEGEACTFGTRMYARENTGGKLAFIDTGGFLDTRGVNWDICNLSSLKCAEALYAIVVVISSSMILENHSSNFIALVLKLQRAFKNPHDGWKSVLFAINDKQARYYENKEGDTIFYSEEGLHELIYDSIRTISSNSKVRLDSLLKQFNLTFDEGKRAAMISELDPNFRSTVSQDQIDIFRSAWQELQTWDAILENMGHSADGFVYKKSNFIIVKLKGTFAATISSRNATRERIISIVQRKGTNEVPQPAFMNSNFDAISLFNANVSNIRERLKIVCNVAVRYLNKWILLMKELNERTTAVLTREEIDGDKIVLKINDYETKIGIEQNKIARYESDELVKLNPITATIGSRFVIIGKIFKNPTTFIYNDKSCPFEKIQHEVEEGSCILKIGEKHNVTRGYFTEILNKPADGYYKCTYTPGYHSSVQIENTEMVYLSIDSTARIVPLVKIKHATDYINAKKSSELDVIRFAEQRELEKRKMRIFKLCEKEYKMKQLYKTDEYYAEINKLNNEIDRKEMENIRSKVGRQFGYFQNNEDKVLRFGRVISALIVAFDFKSDVIDKTEYNVFMDHFQKMYKNFDLLDRN